MNGAEWASNPLAMERKSGYVFLVLIHASLTAIHYMLEEGEELEIVEGRSHLNRRAIYPVTHSKVEEGGKMGNAEEGMV